VNQSEEDELLSAFKFYFLGLKDLIGLCFSIILELFNIDHEHPGAEGFVLLFEDFRI